MRTLDMGIKGFKRLLKENKNLTKAQKNAAVRAYKARITERLLELKEQMDKGLNEPNGSESILSKKGLDKHD